MRAVILCYYGAVQSIDDLSELYTSIFGNREPSATYMDKAKKRFLQSSTADPLYTISNRQQKALQRRFNEKNCNIEIFIARKHTAPKIEVVLEEALEKGATSIDLVPMSPLYTKGGGAYYLNRANKFIQNHHKKIEVRLLSGWYNNQRYQEAFKERLQDAINWLPRDSRPDVAVIFTSHSQMGKEKHNELFIQQYTDFCKLISDSLRIENWKMAYRSAGPPPQIWLGPDLLEVIREVAAGGAKAIVVADVLSPVENIEVMFDVRHDAQILCEELQVDFSTVAFLDDADDFMTALEEWILLHNHVDRY